MEEEYPGKKEITIRLNLNTLKKAGYILLVLVLIGIIIAQYYDVIPSRYSSEEKITAQAVNDNNKSNETFELAEEPAEEIQEEDSEEEIEEEPDEDASDDETDEEKLPITGKVTLSIDKLDIVIKNEDYARINSVKFTIKNQKSSDFIPTVDAHLTEDTYDKKDITLEKLESGKSITKTSSDLTFGYDEIDKEHTIKLELYDEHNNLLTSVTESFDTR
ncbi:hypothetical protein GF336_05540 [Candidatus Woesearchaeota archaeon]|nr:hypothetical protein [Candidatus Woesearchaeota archaeon]